MNLWVVFFFLQQIHFLSIICKRQNEGRLIKEIELKDLSDSLKSLFKRTAYINEGKVNRSQRKYLREALSDIDATKFQKWLRQEAVAGVEETTIREIEDEFEGLVENELLNALSKKTSALLDRPYVQKKGRNDFLVIRPDLKDPFVTIVPNDIYYNSEKKCVNWLDDCNQKGLRERLLQKVNSPYKK